MNLTWIGPALLAGCVAGAWWFGGTAGITLLVVALTVTVARAMTNPGMR